MRTDAQGYGIQVVLLKPSFKKFSGFPFNVSLYLFIIEVTVLPILIYIIYFYNTKIGLDLMVLGVLGLFLAVSSVVYLFFIINNSIQRIVLKSKEGRLVEVISQLEECEEQICEIKKSKLLNFCIR